MECFCMKCEFMDCFTDTYLHLFINETSNIDVVSDINIAGTKDIYLRIKYLHTIQDSKIFKNETQTISFREPIVLENAKPHPNDPIS